MAHRWALVVALLAAPSAAWSNGDAPADGPATVFERFVLSACSPCVRESYLVGSLATAPMPLSGAPRAAAAAAARPGEIAIEVLRAQQLGRPGWTSLALRVTLSVIASSGGESYRLATGLLDGADVRTLADAVAELAKTAAAPAATVSPESTDIDFHGGSLRVGVLRMRGESVAYVQAGDLRILLQRSIWEVPTTLYLPVKDLPALAAALGQAAATIEKVR
ncbi:MAG: hypothetical protein ACRELA_08685 [Candidatus Rokuibacteriota bacterium]